MYTAYVLTEDSKSALLERFPPKYSTVVAHHITVKFGVSASEGLPERVPVTVVGYIDNEEGLEALVVSVNRSVDREDGKTYHITWSLDEAKFKPVDSNDLIRSKKYTIVMPIHIKADPALLG